MKGDELREKLSAIVVQLYGEKAGDFQLTRTVDPKFGDFSCNIALKASKELNKKPMELARELASKLKDIGLIEKIEVKEPGFINFFLKESYWQEQLSDVLKSGDKFGSNDIGEGKKARIEFVSANPTGPLHFGNARGGPIGDSLGRVLEASGYEVLREYIDNDEGNQVEELGKTLAARAGLIKAKEEDLAYKGSYTLELSKMIKVNQSQSESEIVKEAGRQGVKILFEEIIEDCKAMGITFDHIVHESELRSKAKAELLKLEKKGLLKQRDDATWFAPRNEFLEDRDAVVVKSDGNYTYFTADVVYHTEKFESRYDLVVDIFGSNTSGHVPKLKALASTLDFPLEKFIVILYQFVRIKRGSDTVKMSKRAGNFVTVREVLDEVGKDALRFFILMHDPNTHMDFDLELAKEKSSKNPVYYVQYAHARISSILAKSQVDSKSKSNYKLLSSKFEIELIRQITKLPELVRDISKGYKVHQLTSYAIGLADSFHKFYENCRVISDDKDLTSARLDLVRATQIGLANTLEMIGVSAPEKM